MTELLLNLPNEVIDLIFQSIPNSLLIGLEDIPPIRPYVLNQLYKSVIVGYPLSSTHTVKHNDIVDDLKLSTQDYIPTFINYRELINFINTNLLHPPEEIFFTNPLEILIVDETYPDLLSNSKISTTFKQFTTTHHNHQDEAYLEKLSHISYHKINDANFINTSHFPTIWKINHRSCRYYIQIPDFFTNLPSFHLSKLEIGPLQSLNADLAKCIPDTISSLDCTIDPGSHINGTLVMMRDFILPKRLVSLTMNFEIEMCPKVLDLSLMDRLKYLYLRYDSSCFDVVYPSAVIGVMGDSGIDVCDLFRMCRSPLLVFDHLGPLRMGDGGVRIGERLTEMRVGCVTIYEMIVNQLVRFSGSCLRKLTVRCCKGTMSSQQCFDSDAEVVDFRELSGLQELDVACMNPYFKIRNIPGSVISLHINLSRSCYDYNELQTIHKLKSLKITNFPNPTFNPILPISLTTIELNQPLCTKINLDQAQNLNRFILTNHDIGQINNNTLSLPNSLSELILSNNSFHKIHNDYTFPKSLCILHLDRNFMSHIPTSSLTCPQLHHLSISHNPIGSNDIQGLISTLPFHNLNVLEMRDIGMKKMVDLSMFVNLHSLDISENIFDDHVFDMLMLPKSLTKLSLEGCCVGMFSNGSWLDFEMLSEVDLSFNRDLVNYFESNDVLLFGDLIERVKLRGIAFSSPYVMKLNEVLRSKKKFVELVVDAECLPSSLQYVYKKTGIF